MSNASSARRPNLIYIFADQMRYDACGYTGNILARTPAIDRFAAESLNFRQAVATAPVCTAYRATLFTGKYTTSTGMVINELRINPNQRCLGHLLTDADYETGYIGKWHLYANELGNHDDPKNSFVPRGPHRLGFDGEWAAYNFHHVNYGEQAYYHTETPRKIHYGEGVYEADGQTDLAIDFLNRHADSPLPFALVLSYGPPHDPWSDDNTPADLRGMFDPADFPNPPNYRAQNDSYGDAWSRLSEAERRRLPHWRANYAAQVTSIDQNFARLMRRLDELSLSSDTVVVFTSDHGEMFGAHGRRAKNIFYEEACRIPLLMRWPGHIPAGGVSDACIGTVDLLPTLMGLLRIQCPADVQGMNLAALALAFPDANIGSTSADGSGVPPVGGSGSAPAVAPEAAMMMICGATAAWDDGHEWRAMRDARHTYAVYRRDGCELLFDHVADPYQMHNRIADSSLDGLAERMRLLLRQTMAHIGDEFRPCSWYRNHWTDGDRRIIRSATADWSRLPLDPGASGD